MVAHGIPVVVPEPSCLSTFRDELPALLWRDPRGARLAALARSPAEHLLTSSGFEALLAKQPLTGGDGRPHADSRRVVIHPHCQGRPVGLSSADAALLERLGFAPEVLDAGCCGLAGSFGYSHEHEAISRQIGEEQWLPRVTAALHDGDVLVADGYSCTMQLAHLSDRRSTSLVSMVRRSLGI